MLEPVLMKPTQSQMLEHHVTPTESDLELTVLITFFGESANVTNLLDDLLSQSTRPNRIVIVDDCAPEPARDVLEQRTPSEIPIDIFRLSKNRGNGYSQAFGVEQISTPLVVLVGADDRLLSSHIESLLRQYKISPGVVCPGVVNIWPNGRQAADKKRIALARLAERTDLFETLLRGNWTIGASLYPRKALIDHGNFSHIRRSSDYEMMLHLASSGTRITQSQQFTYLYRRRSKNEPKPVGLGGVLTTRQRVLNTFADRSRGPHAGRTRRRALFERRVGSVIPKRAQASITLLSIHPLWWLANVYALYLNLRYVPIRRSEVHSQDRQKGATDSM